MTINTIRTVHVHTHTWQDLVGSSSFRLHRLELLVSQGMTMADTWIKSYHENDTKTKYGGRDLIGYGAQTPSFKWPKGAKVALNFVSTPAARAGTACWVSLLGSACWVQLAGFSLL
jgi:hypothetical protein